jgi:anti-sigma factor RsiW
MTRREFTIRDIHMALDGEMPPEDRDDYEAWLNANPEMRAANSRFAVDRARLQEVFGQVADEQVPERLTRLLSDERQHQASWKSWWRAAAVAAALIASAGVGYVAAIYGQRPEESGLDKIVEQALQAHVMYAAEKLHVVEVGADQRDHLVGWLSKRVGINLVAPDLTAEGFKLVGGRLLPASGKPAAQFMYQDHEGTRVSLYVTTDAGAGEIGFRLYEEEGARTFYWTDNGFCYAVSGAISENSLLALANIAYRQLLGGTAS